MSANPYPPVAFHFDVWLNIPGGTDDVDARFSKVSGLSVTMQTQDLHEGGQNAYAYKLPVRPAYGTVVLERGLAVSSKLMKWVRSSLEDFTFSPATMVISLLGQNHRPVAVWSLEQAWPIGWSMGDLDAMENRLCLEKLELACARLSLQR